MKRTCIVIDITSLVSVSFISGIQRVVREIVTRMVAKRSNEYTQFCLIAYNLHRRSYCSVSVKDFLDCYMHGRIKSSKLIPKELYSFDDLGAADMFFDIDSVWNNRMRRSFLLPILKLQGVMIVVHIFDIIPILNPQYCDDLTTIRFMDYLGAHLLHADMIIANTHSTIHDIETLSENIGSKKMECACVPLGANFLNTEISEGYQNNVDQTAVAIAQKCYLLMVGTIEPRKNHEFILDAYENVLRKEGFSLVIAGRHGWNVDRLMLRIRGMQKDDDHFLYLDSTNDETINYLYKHAFFTVFPTQNEGFGLPIIESILHKTPVLATDIPVLREVGGDLCDYYPINDNVDLLHKLLYYKNSPESYSQRKKQLESFVPISWDQTEIKMWAELQKLIKK